MIKLERGTCFSRNTSILPSSIFLPWQHHIFLRQFYNLIKIKNIHQNITIDFQKHALTVYGITAAYMSFSPATTNMLPLCNPRPIPIQPCPSCHGKAVDSCEGGAICACTAAPGTLLLIWVPNHFLYLLLHGTWFSEFILYDCNYFLK